MVITLTTLCIFNNGQSWFPGMYWCMFHPEAVENTWWIRPKGPCSWTLQLHLYTRRQHQVYGGLCSTLLITEAPPHRTSKLQLTRGLYGAQHAITELCTQPLQQVICFRRWKTPESQYTIICRHRYYGPALSPRPCSLGSEHVLCWRKAALCHHWTIYPATQLLVFFMILDASCIAAVWSGDY